ALDRLLDVDGFIACLAAESAVVNLDGYGGEGHNFYLYDDPARARFAFIAWDLDQSFGQTLRAKKEDVIAWDVFDPEIGGKLLVDRLLADPDLKTRYAEKLRSIATGPLSPFDFARRVFAEKRLIGPAVARDPSAPFGKAMLERSLV